MLIHLDSDSGEPKMSTARPNEPARRYILHLPSTHPFACYNAQPLRRPYRSHESSFHPFEASVSPPASCSRPTICLNAKVRSGSRYTTRTTHALALIARPPQERSAVSRPSDRSNTRRRLAKPRCQDPKSARFRLRRAQDDDHTPKYACVTPTTTRKPLLPSNTP